MSYSWNTFDDTIRHILEITQPQKVLDVGAGQGKYGKLIRQFDLASTRVTAVECDPALQASLLAEGGYADVWPITAQQLLDRPSETYDMVIMGDVIEHLKHSDGRDLLEFLNYRATFIMIVTPECMPMNLGVFYEGHNSLWRPDSFAWHDRWAHQRCGVMHFYLLRGLINIEGPTLGSVVEHLNRAGLSAEHHTTGALVPINLEIHDTVYREPDGKGGLTQYRSD